MTATVDEKREVFNVPNQVTAARLLVAIIVFVLIPLHAYLSALLFFLIAASTDWIDGYWARKYGQITQLGRIFDPFADKIIICGAFILLAVEMKGIRWGIQGWMAVIVVGREMLVTALRSFIERAGGDFSATMAGKVKMVLQCAAVVAALVVLNYDGEPVPTWVLVASAICIWSAVLATIWSGAGYIVAAAKFLRA